jgi:ABC-type multidrug transport system fused ATPase/permease subunit
LNDSEWILQEIGLIVGCAIFTPSIFNLFKNVLNLYYIDLNQDAEYEKLDKVLTLRPERRSENVPSLEEIQTLKFNSVSFDYIPYGLGDKVNLDKIEFEVKKGEKLGIIGLPGSGKSTIADLITKIIRPRQGNVLINNCDINKVNTNYLRSIVTYVPEEYQLLNTSIEKNVTYPLKLDEYKYNDALNKCKLKDLIFSLPQRDETNAKSISLSGSDIQKISLANAFYKESPIMILDDATSKLDSVTEDEIMSEFFKLKNKISIVITNRINNIVKCDKVLIISNGKIVEYGSVEELMSKRNSTFSKMVTDANLNKKVV